MNMNFCYYFNMQRDVVTGLLIFVDSSHFNHTVSNARIETHTQ